MTKREKEIELILWFLPETLKQIPITQKDIDMYFEWSEQGKHKDKLKLSHFDDGFNALVTAKGRRGLTVQLWEDGVIEGTVPYYTLLGGSEGHKRRAWYNPMRWVKGKDKFWNIPVRGDIVDYMKKEMFKGKDADLIEKLYKQIYD